ncbi:MAG TPA: PepSY-like domain-containing protein [Bacteroidia bacterium]|jgi:hypothetical protein|nr:PepSY-like domain-containing protein [Bacteroidia bacterium]
MKKVILILAIAMIGSVSYAQTVKEENVPSAVKMELVKKYPSVKVDKWEKRDGDFVAKFDENSTATCVVIDAKGNWLKSKSHIEASMLPRQANDYITANYKGKTVSEAWQVNHASGKSGYEAKVGETVLVFDSAGKFIKTEKK